MWQSHARWARSTQWPTGGGGFEYFYGFIGGETNQYYPALYEGTTPVEPPKTPGRGLPHSPRTSPTSAINWVRQQKALMPDKPFFMYFAPGATHAPHHVAQGVVRQVQGQVRSAAGTSCARRRFARQKKLGVDPAGRRADATPRRDPRLGRDADEDLKPVLARQMEVYAGLPGAHRPPDGPA